jgi:hypothetical protein
MTIDGTARRDEAFSFTKDHLQNVFFRKSGRADGLFETSLTTTLNMGPYTACLCICSKSSDRAEPSAAVGF